MAFFSLGGGVVVVVDTGIISFTTAKISMLAISIK